MKQTITFLCFAVFALSISAQTVNIQGDPYGGNPYASITDAITAANGGDVILITGVHTEPISIGKSITLKGTDPSTDIIQAAASASNTGTGSRVIGISEGNYTITIENLGIRYGNADSNSNGGGIDSDKVTGLLTLKNLIIEDNHSSRNGGGLGLAGTIANIESCIIRNNNSTLDGGGIIAAPNNGAGTNSLINIKQTLINNNTGRNGGGLYINGNNGFGNNYLIDVTIENSTISNNSTTSASGGNGGGAIFSASALWTGDGTSSNITLSLIHATVYNNSHAAPAKSGLQFAGAGGDTNFSAYNSIVVAADDLTTKAINFNRTNTTNVVNCILGGLENAAAFLFIIDDMAKNNQKGRTATEAGLTGALTDEGGNTLVLAITESSTADDYCTASTGITLPTIDQRGYTREGVVDAGAYEFQGTLSVGEIIATVVKVFPNPSRDVVRINSTNEISSIKIYSVLGALEKVVYGKKEITVSDLSSGLHMMIIESNNQSVAKRLIIE